MEGDALDTLVAITGASEPVARRLLDISNGDVSQAVVLFYDTDTAAALQREIDNANATQASGGAAAGSSSAATGTTRRRNIGREDENGVVHIDSDDDDDDDDGDDDNDSSFHPARSHIHNDTATVERIAKTAQEEEDEAMAKRLQEEMYADTAGAGIDGVRAPIGRTTEVLVEPSYGSFGGFGDFGGSSSAYEPLRQRRPGRGPINAFNQVWEDDGTGVLQPVDSISGSGRNSSTPQQARLADLFRPPYDLIENVSWDEAREMGKTEKRWILANIQDMADFNCQTLNRDIWKDAMVKELVRENFVFLQYAKEDPGAEPYIQYYMPGGQHENPDNYPHVGIVDPRTGEQVKVWSGQPFPSATEFHSQLVEFLDRYSLDSSKKNPVQRSKPRLPVKDVGRMTEEEMLEMALQNSLAGAGSGGGGGSGSGGTGSSSRPSVQDPDELTTDKDEPAAAEKAVDEGSAEASTSPFARIASDRPHEEPANNPATTTRIQFRHPTGRVIRRFAVDDHVVRIYEWLKSAPLEGKAGIEFELKTVPQGHDLIEDLDKTIAEVGLKNATVMIEFIED